MRANLAIISPHATDIFDTFSQVLPGYARDKLDQVLDTFRNNTHTWAPTLDFTAQARILDGVIDHAVQGFDKGLHHSFRLALVSRLALDSPDRILKANLPESILALYPSRFDCLADYLLNVEVDGYDHRSDAFCKDVRFVLVLTVPLGALVGDLQSYIPLKSALASVVRSRQIHPFFSWLKAKGYGVWLRTHVDSRYLEEFKEFGRDKSYLRVAELLSKRPDHRGLTGTSWYFDPQVTLISPHLSYLRNSLLERGAAFMRHTTGPEHVERATATSRTRSRLYREGKYIPVCYSLIWPRSELLAWASSVSTEAQSPESGDMHD